ncbi:MAG: hypothetical protein LBV36_06765 [Chromatiales bacterium]|jgi:hypothetical protein|nr:hypothetical protein [Chromatiales bacterium]
MRFLAQLRFCCITLVLVMMPLFFSFSGATVLAAESSGDGQVIRAFTEAQRAAELRNAIPDQRKHLILFVMGIALLICLLTAAGLGVAMAIYGKKVFVAHTIFAGFSVTLAIVHAVVAIVWFFPF